MCEFIFSNFSPAKVLNLGRAEVAISRQGLQWKARIRHGGEDLQRKARSRWLPEFYIVSEFSATGSRPNDLQHLEDFFGFNRLFLQDEKMDWRCAIAHFAVVYQRNYFGFADCFVGRFLGLADICTGVSDDFVFTGFVELCK